MIIIFTFVISYPQSIFTSSFDEGKELEKEVDEFQKRVLNDIKQTFDLKLNDYGVPPLAVPLLGLIKFYKCGYPLNFPPENY